MLLTLDEYCDVDLCGDATYENDNICRIIEDNKVVSVVGKHRLVLCRVLGDRMLCRWLIVFTYINYLLP